MPYITKGQRERLDEFLYSLASKIRTAGELNYAASKLAFLYSLNHEAGMNYQNLNDAFGALEGAKLEFYRRVVAPYEDKKIEQNGDVF